MQMRKSETNKMPYPKHFTSNFKWDFIGKDSWDRTIWDPFPAKTMVTAARSK
jgi:hypothetical protein